MSNQELSTHHETGTDVTCDENTSAKEEHCYQDVQQVDGVVEGKVEDASLPSTTTKSLASQCPHETSDSGTSVNEFDATSDEVDKETNSAEGRNEEHDTGVLQQCDETLKLIEPEKLEEEDQNMKETKDTLVSNNNEYEETEKVVLVAESLMQEEDDDHVEAKQEEEFASIDNNEMGTSSLRDVEQMECSQEIETNLPEKRCKVVASNSNGEESFVAESPEAAGSLQIKAPVKTQQQEEEGGMPSASLTVATPLAETSGVKASEKFSAKSKSVGGLDSVYYLKWFHWQGIQTPLVTQNENGPCPLLAIANVLMLSRKIQIPSMQEFITAQQLMEHIGDYILSLTPKENNDEEFILNYEQNMQDAIAIMHKLQTGIDVNVKFTGCNDFEFTSECVVFDLLHIGLYHGWLVDPQDLGTVKAIGSLSYNQIVEKIIASKEVSAEEGSVTEGILAENFLEQTASQLTYHGLCELTCCVAPSELCVFFRNNHFSTLFKHNDKLFLLVTDQGYLTEPRIIWETLSNVEGDGEFVNADFKAVGPLQSYTANPRVENPSAMSQEDSDYLVALSLQDKASDSTQNATPWGVSTEELLRQEAAEQERKDRLLAIRLQEQERQMVAEQQRQQRTIDPRLVQHGRGYQADRPAENRVRVPKQGHVVGDEDRPQGKCSIL